MRRPPEQLELLNNPEGRRMALEATMWVAVRAYDNKSHHIEQIMGSMRDLLADLKLVDDAKDLALSWNAGVQK